MKLLIVDPAGNGLDIAVRAMRHGHQVKMFIRQAEKTQHIGRGIVELVDDFKPWLRWADLVFNTDNTRYLRDLDAARAEGILVVGASSEAAEWELDRDCGMKVLRKAGVAIPPSVEFTDYDTAIAHVKKEDKRFVSKPSGDADKALSYCSKSPVDMIYMLERWKKMSKLKTPFILQEFIPGIEMAVGGWFGPGGFNVGWCENFEFKKLMNDDMGVATGEQGTVVRYVRRSKLADKVLAPVEQQLEKLGYVGYVDVNCIIADDGTPYPLEFTMRPGWPTFNIQQALHEGDCIEWLLDLAQGKDSRCVALDTVAIGVVLSIPDYPYSHLTRKEVVGVPIYGVTASMWEWIHPCEMMLSETVNRMGDEYVHMPMPATAGDYVLVVSATGLTVVDARDRAYRRLKRLSVPNSPMYRTDIGNRLSKQLPKLQRWGYARGLRFTQNLT